MKSVLSLIVDIYIIVDKVSTERILERRFFEELISSTDGYLTPTDFFRNLNHTIEESSLDLIEEQFIFNLVVLSTHKLIKNQEFRSNAKLLLNLTINNTKHIWPQYSRPR